MGKHKEKSKKHKQGKRHKEMKKERRSRKSSSSSSASSEEWVEKVDDSTSDEGSKDQETKNPDEANSSKRDEWMSLSTSFATESNIDRRKNREENKRLERERDQYNPREHTRELNPYWKDGGDGLPQFKKPAADFAHEKKYESVNRKHTSSWRKKPVEDKSYESSKKSASPNFIEKKRETKSEEKRCESPNFSSKKHGQSSRDFVEKESKVESQEEPEVFTDKQLNLLASKLVKAEIMGKTELVQELKQKLAEARKRRVSTSEQSEEVILTHTDSQGSTRPFRPQSSGESSGSYKKKRKVETHQDGQRVRYFADDDKHSLQQMFENEKMSSVSDQNSEFLKMATTVRKNDDLEDVFADNIRNEESDEKIEKKRRDRAIDEHQRVVRSVERCKFCIQSDSMPKHLMVSLGETVFLSLPPYEPLTEGHCLIVPIRHVTCSTLLDENEWTDVMDFRRALTRMYSSKNEDVIFFETAKNLQRYPHMYIECIPVDKEEGDAAPIYFKKAIDECEAEWAQNKKLVSLKGKDVRRAVPKGLSYFFVSFGMEEGYAHVIEDEKHFPANFAQEVIGGMLDLHHSKWRKPKIQNFEEQSKRAVEFTKEWSDFDCTKT